MKEIVVLSPVAYFSPHFNTRKDKACCPAFVFSRGAFNVFWDLVLYLMNEGLNIWYNAVPIFKNSTYSARF